MRITLQGSHSSVELLPQAVVAFAACSTLRPVCHPKGTSLQLVPFTKVMYTRATCWMMTRLAPLSKVSARAMVVVPIASLHLREGSLDPGTRNSDSNLFYLLNIHF